MLISPQHNFIFFKPMKCAGSSIEKSLLPHCSSDALCTGGTSLPLIIHKNPYDEYPQVNNKYIDAQTGGIATRFHSHTDPALFLKKIKDKKKYKNYLKVTIIRSPWTQLVSWYWWNYYEIISNPIKQNMIILKSDSIENIKKKFNLFLNFNAMFISNQSIESNEKMTYCEFLSSTNEKFINSNIDEYLRFENINVDFQIIFKSKIKSKINLFKLKSNFKKINNHYSDYYNDASIALVNQYFKKTINIFKYKFKENHNE